MSSEPVLSPRPAPAGRGSVLMVVAGEMRNGVPQMATFVRTQVEFLRRAGWEVGLGLVDNRTSPAGVLRNMVRLRRQVKRLEPSIVHAQYGSVTALLGAMVKGRRPFVVSFWGDDLLGTPIPGIGWRVREALARFLGLQAARFSSATIVMSRNLRESLPAPIRDRSVILPHGIDLEFFRPMDPAECRKSLGWPPDGKVILFNGSKDGNEQVKNPALARRAFAELERLHPDVTLRILSRATPEQVRMMLNAADCLLVTSLHEGSPNIVKEAMACNLPVVSVPCGDVQERLSETFPGAVCPYDPLRLAEAINGVLLASRRSNGRRRLAAQEQSADDICRKLCLLYDSIRRPARESL